MVIFVIISSQGTINPCPPLFDTCKECVRKNLRLLFPTVTQMHEKKEKQEHESSSR
jgi:hypothetical protein